MPILNLYLVSTIISASLTAFLGLLVALHNRQGVTNKIFIIHSFVGAFWSIATYLSVSAPPAQTLWWVRLVLFCAVPHVFLFFLFTKNFPHETLNLKKSYLSATLVWMFILMGLTLTPYVFSGTITNDGNVVPVPGSLITVFGASLVIFFLLTTGLVFYKYFKSETEIKKPWLTIGIGLLVSYTLLIFFVFLRVIISDDTRFVPYSPLFILPIFIGAAYAILKHQLFSIKVIAAELLAFILLITSFIQVITAANAYTLILSISVTAFTLITSTLLIGSVLKEVKQREQLQVLTKKLGNANEQLKALDQARAEFISIASHQLRTPPATIKWYLSAILTGDYGQLDPGVKEALQKTERTNNLLISLIEDLLNVSRIERGKMEFLFEPTDVEAITQTTFEQLQPMAKEKGLELTYKKPLQKPPLVMADKEKLRQVINNLVDNAVKYTKKGCVIVGLNQTSDNEIRFQVTDTGKGIDPENISSIFDKYTRGKNSVHESTGLGLGLYVAKVVIGQHKGKIWAESPGHGQGSTFIFTIPIQNDLEQTTLLDLTALQQPQRIV